MPQPQKEQGAPGELPSPCVDGETEAQEQQGLLEDTETALGGRDQTIFTERGAGLANGLELSFMKLVLQRAWQSQVLNKNHSWRRAESWGTECTWSGGARHRE